MSDAGQLEILILTSRAAATVIFHVLVRGPG
jgi:hypothetical protein